MMRAALYRGPRQLDITDVPEPTTGPGQVKIKVGYNGICGTDIHEYLSGPVFFPTEPHPLTGQQLPIIMGHEFSGTVVEIGAGVSGTQIGDRVAIEPMYRCGQCQACVAGHYNICQKVGFQGLMADGGMAEYNVVPANMLHLLPDNVSLELGALVEPMAVAYHAAALGSPVPDEVAVVFGAGPIGLGLWFALRGMGIASIYIVETSADRRRAVEALGATTLDPGEVDVPAFIMDLTSGRGAGAVYDAAGVKPAVDAALACVGARRTVVSVAIYDKPMETPLLSLVLNESRVQGSLGYTGSDYQSVIAMMAKGAYDTTGWVDTIALKDVVDIGFKSLMSGEKMKLLVDPFA